MTFKERRRKKIAGRPFPAGWQVFLERNVPFCSRLPPPDQEELRRHILVFLAEKRFEGCGGLLITDEIRLTIAAQACVLLLHRRTDYFPHLRTILVYPSSYVAASARHIEGGLILEGREARLGESWHRGSVVLAWDDVRRSAADIHDGHNVVFHEFAHQLDSSGGKGDSTPILQSRSSFIAWARALGEDFERFRRDIANRHPAVLDEYGATNAAEFFAVATEAFFERPIALQGAYPRLYEQLKRFYQQDPATLGRPPESQACERSSEPGP